MSAFTEFTDYIYLGALDNKTREAIAGWSRSNFADHEGYEYTSGASSGKYTFTGKLTAEADMEGFEKFLQIHDDIDANTLYLVRKRGTDDYEVFRDHTGTNREYLRGVLKKITTNWSKSSPAFNIVRAVFWRVWRD